jgi:hypothetical protein
MVRQPLRKTFTQNGDEQTARRIDSKSFAWSFGGIESSLLGR